MHQQPEKSDIGVALVDDDPVMLKFIGRMLFKLGFPNVTLFDNGRAALSSMTSPAAPPQLILCDLNMPEMDGIEFIRELVAIGYTGHLILISGEDERVLQTAETLVRAHRIAILGHLRKPVDQSALAALLADWSPTVSARTRAAPVVCDPDALRAAIANGELVNHYQPKVHVASGRVVGVEALVRWQPPQTGLVFPDQFIGIAEKHGLIDDLTRVVVTTALGQLRRWNDAGLPLRVAINVSMDNLNSLDFADFVAAAAAAAGVAPQNIVLEVTESRLMEDLRAPLEILTRLRLKRFRLSIDDFGTGHSSFSQLRDIPFDELKIDRGFVHGAGANPTVRAIYDASLGLARDLGMDIVAEGVEDLDDWQLLRDTGCDFAQGYFIAKPMAAADLPRWMAAWPARLAELLATTQ